MLCKIADLIVEVPESGGMLARCADYRYDGESKADIEIRESLYDPGKYPAGLTREQLAYVESARLFYINLVDHSGFYLHSSAVAKDGKAFLFSGRSGMGKSTHTRLWQQEFGAETVVFNDDKPALRYLDGVWYAYGTPWCGKDGINSNMKVPLAGICFLKQAGENRIRRLTEAEVLQRILPQTVWNYRTPERVVQVMAHLDDLVKKIPVFELENRPEAAAAQLSYTTMRQAAEEMGL